jgi:hypothetical protein
MCAGERTKCPRPRPTRWQMLTEHNPEKACRKRRHGEQGSYENRVRHRVAPQQSGRLRAHPERSPRKHRTAQDTS